MVAPGAAAGIGFTVSLFVAGLSFDGVHLAEAKVAILAAVPHDTTTAKGSSPGAVRLDGMNPATPQGPPPLGGLARSE